nr:acyl-CoA synthetase [Pseudohoeflea sp. DP4N28-3]
MPEAKTYAALASGFSWKVPERYNIGVDVCDKWADREPDREALIHVTESGSIATYSFADLQALSNRLANALVGDGLRRGDRVGILLPQAPETAFGHIAVLKAGGIAVPLFTLFGPEALQYRLGDAGVSVVITDRDGAGKLAGLRRSLPALRRILVTDGPVEGGEALSGAMAGQSDHFTPVDTSSDDPAFINYTSGTTGPPKGALHAHRVLLGHLPGVEMSHDLFPRPGDRMWTPADWAWIGGLLDVLMPALHHGVTVVARRFGKFSGEDAFQHLQDFKIRNTFLPPTALKMMRAVPNASDRWNLDLRTVASGGETLGAELLDWGRRVFGVTINEFYGQTECNMVVSSCSALMAARPGVMGRAVPGHQVSVVDDSGTPAPIGEAGHIGVRRPDPVMFLGYWNNPDATERKFAGEWMLTGDRGVQDEDGWIRFVGRNDDVITSSGYRIGPGEIEDCLIGHPAVRMAGVVGKPDAHRTEIVKAYIVLDDSASASADLAREIQEWVKTRLAAHEYPREIAFVEALPMTTTGKIIRKQLRERAARE